jgi:hypothetical protein
MKIASTDLPLEGRYFLVSLIISPISQDNQKARPTMKTVGYCYSHKHIIALTTVEV